jgi:peptidoglycan/xylan/chitin deacetylase (PgdA/CDA1 family)
MRWGHILLKSTMRIPQLSVLFAMVALGVGWGWDAKAAETPTPTRKIVITVDDIPGRLEKPTLRQFQDINRRIVAALKAEKVPAIGFVNERFLQIDGERDQRVRILRTWVDGGLGLGNHLYRHRSLSRTPLAQYQDDVLRGEVLTRQVLAEKNLPLVYFRHPFLHAGPTKEIKQGFEKFLGERGYKVAPATFDHSDWVFTRVYESARASGDRKLEKRTRQTFLEYFEATCAHFEQVSDELFGRQIPQILVTHANRINADLMPAWLKLLRARGYSFVSLDEALADPAYASPDGYIGPEGVSWMDRWSLGLKKPLKKRPAPEVPDDIQARYDVIAEKAPEVNE